MPVVPAKDVFVLIPGIMGSVLERDGHDVWAPTLSGIFQAIGSLGGSLQRMRLEQDDPDTPFLADGFRATKLMPDVTILPGLMKIDGYSTIAAELRGRFGLVAGKTYREFPYDWRRDLRSAAKRLAAEAQEWLGVQRKEVKDARLVLVCHSMGGLVARYFLEVLGGWSDTRALVTIATPHQGSVKALDYLANGFRKGLGPITLLDLTEVLRSFTSIYQLLPTYPCVELPTGHVVRASEVSGLPGVDKARVVGAFGFHDEILSAARKNPERAVDLFPVVGTYQPTLQSVRFTSAGVAAVESLGGLDFDGDGTVPRLSATPLEQVHQHREHYWCGVHGALQSTTPVLEQIDGIYKSYVLETELERLKAARRSREIRAGMVDVAVSVDDAFTADEPVSVRARASGEGVPLDAVVIDAATGEEAGRAMLHPTSDGWQAADFGVLPPGVYRLRVGSSAPGVNDVTDFFGVCGGGARALRGLAVPRAGSAPISVEWDSNIDVLETGDQVTAEPWSRAAPSFVVLRRRRGAEQFFYAYTPAELLRLRGQPLHETLASPALDAQNAPAGLSREQGGNDGPAAHRFVSVDKRGDVVAVGVPSLARAEPEPKRAARPRHTGGRTSRSAAPGLEAGGGGGEMALPEAEPPLPEAEPPLPEAEPPLPKPEPLAQGETWSRYPDVLARRAVARKPIDIVVRLTTGAEVAASTPMAIRGVVPGATSVDLRVQVTSPWLDMGASDGWADLTVPRDGDAELTIAGTVRASAAGRAAIDVFVHFYVGNRECGSARAAIPLAGDGAVPGEPESVLVSSSAVDVRDLPAPRATICINQIGTTQLFWTLSAPDASLDVHALHDLKSPAASWVQGVFALCGTMNPDKESHVPLMEGIGQQLWGEIPDDVRAAYLTLRKKWGGFAIQIITDEPNIPWELATPLVDAAWAEPLGFTHPIARWVTSAVEPRPVKVGDGKAAVVAPDYSARPQLRRLSFTKSEVAVLQDTCDATEVAGDKRHVLELLEDLDKNRFAIMHFAGHGGFDPAKPSLARLCLSDADLVSLEVRRSSPGEHTVHPLIFLNACEVGAGGAALSSVAGFAEAFLYRHCGGVVAPLWSVFDCDASDASKEFYELLHQPGLTIAEAVRRVRHDHGKESPTFYSYVFYGDVMAAL